MLTVRKEQVEVFSGVSRLDFENRMVVHVRKFFPEHYAALDEEKTRQLIRFGIERAAAHSIVNECDVCKFIDLMVAFGPGFEQDPKYPWAAAILADTTFPSPTDKVNTLYDQGLAHLRGGSLRAS